MPHFTRLSDWFDWLDDPASQSRSSLDKVKVLSEKLNAFPSNSQVITVTGTNGKGSFVEVATQLLLAKGFSVGSYTSPHLERYNERIALNGKPVDDGVLLDAFNQVSAVADVEGVGLHFFEFLTLAAFVIFKQHYCDFWVLEVGIGGRLDPVNALPADIGVVTSIGLDHHAYLGDTREAVATEKCGILRDHSQLISAEVDPPEALKLAFITHKNLQIEKDYTVYFDETWIFTDKLSNCVVELPDNGLSPFSQAAAIMMVYHALDLTLDRHALISILDKCSLPGRFQRIEKKGIRYVLDVTHNVQAANFLHHRLAEREKLGKRIAVFSFCQDKDYEGILKALVNDFDAWFIGSLASQRSQASSVIAASLHGLGEHMISVSKNMRQAMARAEQLVKEDDEIVVFGSFLAVADVLPKLKKSIVKENRD